MIVKYLPWLLSAITIWMNVLAGNKHRSAWLIGLVNQALWLGWIVAASAWGFLPMNIALWIVYGRNHLKWAGNDPWRRLLCWFGFCELKKDPRPTNGVWWAFCRHCGGRFGGEYDPATGETHWKPR